MMKKILFVILLLFITKLAFGEVYKWVDEKGVVHFTDDVTQIPEKYQNQIKRMGSEEEFDTIEENESSPQKEFEETRPQEERYQDRVGRGEEYWKGLVEEWNNKLNNAQEKERNLRVKYNELTEKFNDSKSSAARSYIRKERDEIKKEMEKYKNQIEEAKYMLEKKIPEEAEIFKAKKEWIKK
jgi:chromosome segregation ATPase